MLIHYSEWWYIIRNVWNLHLYLTNKLNFPYCMCNVIDHRWRHKEQKKYDTGRSRVAWLLFFTRFCDVTFSVSDLLQYTCTEKCNLFVLYNKNSKGLLKDFWGMKKKNKFTCYLFACWAMTIFEMIFDNLRLHIVIIICYCNKSIASNRKTSYFRSWYIHNKWIIFCYTTIPRCFC